MDGLWLLNIKYVILCLLANDWFMYRVVLLYRNRSLHE